MITIYLKEWDKEEELVKIQNMPQWAKKCLYYLIEKLNYIIVKKIEENRKIYIIPNIEKENIYNRIRKKLEKEKTQTQKLQIVLSHKLKPYAPYFKEYKIVTGKIMYLASLENIIREILEEEPMALQDIYFLANKYKQENIAVIQKLATKVKTVNIITKEVEKYKALEEMMQEQGIVASVANNKKKSLKKAKIIINLDFSKEELMEYSIFRDSVIINTTQEKLSNMKSFNGIIVQDIEITLEENRKVKQEKSLEKAFTQLQLYESLQEGKINAEKIKIVSLYGNHGKIVQKELRNWQKILTNEKN